MIISHKYKIIFIDIYKNAGTYIIDIFKKIDNKHEQKYPHIYAKDAIKNIDPKIWNTYTKFCVVRNSYDWQMSLYYFMKLNIYHGQHKLVKNMSVNEYLEWRKTDLHQQIEFILDDNNKLLIDHIIKFENLENDLIEFFKDKIDIKKYLPQKKINSSKRNHDYKMDYDENGKKMLEEMHKPDIEYFGFKFE